MKEFKLFIRKETNKNFESIGLLELDCMVFEPYGKNHLLTISTLTDDLIERITNILPDSLIVEHVIPEIKDTLPNNHKILKKVIDYIIFKTQFSGSFKEKIDIIFQDFVSSEHSKNDDFKKGFIEYLKQDNSILNVEKDIDTQIKIMEVWSGKTNKSVKLSTEEQSINFYKTLNNVYWGYFENIKLNETGIKILAQFFIINSKLEDKKFDEVEFEEVTIEGDLIVKQREMGARKYKIIKKKPENGDNGKVIIIWCGFFTNYSWSIIENVE